MAERTLSQDLAEYLARAEAIRLSKAALTRLETEHGRHAEALRLKLAGRGPVVSNGRVWRLSPIGGIQGDTYTMDSEIDRLAKESYRSERDCFVDDPPPNLMEAPC